VRRSRLFLSAAFLLLAGLPAYADENPCIAALPKDSLGAVYEYLINQKSTAVHDVMDELAYENDWATHQDAVNAGFNWGQSVFFETLTLGGTFSKSNKDEWKKQFFNHRSRDLTSLSRRVSIRKTLNPAIIRALGESCFETGLWSMLEPAGAGEYCQYDFKVGYRSDKRTGESVTPLLLSAEGGSCRDWPRNTPLAPRADAVSCFRYGTQSLSVKLLTREVGTAAKTTGPLSLAIPPEPKIIETTSPPQTKDVDLWRTWAYRYWAGNLACPQCKDGYYADFSPGVPNARIEGVQFLECRDGQCDHWWRCVNGQPGCASVAGEFSSSLDPKKSCVGEASCRTYRISDDGVNHRDIIRVTYTVTERTCQYCPEGKDFATAHAEWKSRADSLRTATCATDGKKDSSRQELRSGMYWLWDLVTFKALPK
jgi:hypothetical protein